MAEKSHTAPASREVSPRFGYSPLGAMAVDSLGNLYGTTDGGGAADSVYPYLIALPPK